jgi:hypothetical protein
VEETFGSIRAKRVGYQTRREQMAWKPRRILSIPTRSLVSDVFRGYLVRDIPRSVPKATKCSNVPAILFERAKRQSEEEKIEKDKTTAVNLCMYNANKQIVLKLLTLDG